VVAVTVIAMWAHPRAASTAFLRMMIERGDVTVVHEPLVTLTDWQEAPLPARDGGALVCRSAGEIMAHLADLGRDRTVFVKDTLEYRYQHLFDNPDQITGFTHTFIVRDPRKAIASHHAMKPTVSCAEIGYEHQHDLFELARRVTGRTPVVVDADRLVRSPAEVVEAYCAAVGLPFLADALTWQPGDRAEWQRTRQWHVDASLSSGFTAPVKAYESTVDNDAVLRSYYEHHLPYYERLVAHAI
jgi:hypothetical protein